MVKSKYDFIKEILVDKRINQNQRERIFDLASKDIELWKELDNRVKELETIVYRPKSNFDNKKINQILKNKTSKIPEPNPKHVAEFMSLFNHRCGFKYLTHNYDEDGNFIVENYLKKTHSLFEIKTEKELNIPTSLWRIVKEFAFDSKQTEWTSISIDYSQKTRQQIGWASKELRNWCKENKLHPIRNEKFKAIINSFKRITRIERQNLQDLVSICLKEVFGNNLNQFEIITKDLEKADFYTHVQFLKDSLIEILKEIVKRTDSKDNNKIKISYERGTIEKYFLRKLIITHFNSFPNKELELLNKELRSDKGMMGNVNKKIQGYCHWSVETMVEDKPTRINILKESTAEDYEPIDKAEGFKHILTFYYKP